MIVDVMDIPCSYCLFHLDGAIVSALSEGIGVLHK